MENETFGDLVALASFHYPKYAEYLSQTSTKDYAKFLAGQDRTTPG